MARCRRCLLPDRVPLADLDHRGECAYCRGDRLSALDPWQNRREDFARDLSSTLERLHADRVHRRTPYDAMVCLSGGKNSLYLVHRLQREFGLRLLAFTTDVNLPPEAWANMRRTLARLGVDHQVHRPADGFNRKLFAYLLRHQEARGAAHTLSAVYAALVESDALRAATERGIPAVFLGHAPGRPEPERWIYEMPRTLLAETDWTPAQLRDGGFFKDDELARFWNPKAYPAGQPFPRVLAPYHAWPYHADEIAAAVVEHRLVPKASYVCPIRSHYPIQWLLMYSDLRRFGYNPFAAEVSAMIREGQSGSWRWRFWGPVVDFMARHRFLLGRQTKDCLEWLALREDELRVTERRGAYEPAMPVRSARRGARPVPVATLTKME